MDDTNIDRIRGAAVGAAVGDALGMPLEFMPPRHETDLVIDMLSGRIPAGTFTDDTEMALALAESLLDQRSLDAVDLSARFVTWMQGNPPDIGNHTRAVLQRQASGQSWDDAVRDVQRANPASAGNGSVMRCWPVALTWRNDHNSLIHNSVLQSRVTHPHQECTAASVFVNLTISHLLQGTAPYTAVNLAIQEGDIPHALRVVIHQAPHKTRRDLANTGWVRHTLESAVWGLLTTDNFEDAVIKVVNLGSDADTAGAVTGALAGAAYGIDAIPLRWRKTLRGEYPLCSGKIWHSDHLMKLAETLAGIGSK